MFIWLVLSPRVIPGYFHTQSNLLLNCCWYKCIREQWLVHVTSCIWRQEELHSLTLLESALVSRFEGNNNSRVKRLGPHKKNKPLCLQSLKKKKKKKKLSARLTIQRCQAASCAEHHGFPQQRHSVACGKQRPECQCGRWALLAAWAQSDLSPQKSGVSQPEPPPSQPQGLWRADASRCSRGPWGLGYQNPADRDRGVRTRDYYLWSMFNKYLMLGSFWLGLNMWNSALTQRHQKRIQPWGSARVWIMYEATLLRTFY